MLAWLFEVPSTTTEQTVSIFYATSHSDVSIAETCPAFVTLTSLCDVAQKIEMIWSVEVEGTSNQAYASSKQA